MVKASFIMGTRNSEKRIDETIKSIIGQTYVDWELIIIDDASTDCTFKVLSDWSKRDDRIKVYKNKKNLKLAKTLNKCVKLSKGKYLVRIDDDDTCYPERLERQLKFMEFNPQYSICGSGADLVSDGKVWSERFFVQKPTKYDVFSGENFIHPSVILRSEDFKKIGGYNESLDYERCEDYELWCNFYKNGYYGYNLQEKLIRYSESWDDYRKRKKIYRWIYIKAMIKQRKLLKIGIFRGSKEVIKNIIKIFIPNFMIYYLKR